MPNTPDAPDPGAFSSLPDRDARELRREVQAWEYLTTRSLFRGRRGVTEWTGAFLLGIHRDVFGKLFPEQAGRCRTGEAHFGDQAGPAPEHLESLLQQLVLSIQGHLADALAERDQDARFDRTFLYAAIDHAEMIRIHPFVDGNGRWARIATNAFLYDAGLPIGTVIRKADKPEYIAALNRCSERKTPGDLADLLVRGYLRELKKR